MATSTQVTSCRELVDIRELTGQPADGAMLDLAHRHLNEVSNYVADQHGATAQFVDLSHNHLRSVQCLARFECLSTLVLDHNQLTDTPMLPPLPRLNTLWLNHNHITELAPLLRVLRHNCPSLLHLSMINNPCVPSLASGDTRGQLYRYRIVVLASVATLRSLDQQPVQLWERPDADSLWARLTAPHQQWRHLQQQVSVRASELMGRVTDGVDDGFERVAVWWNDRRGGATVGSHVTSASSHPPL